MPYVAFPTYMQWGEKHMNAGRLHAAAVMYEDAADYAATADEEAEAKQMFGIVLRLGGKYDFSEVALTEAHQLAVNPLLRARIARDLAMTLVETLQPGDEQRFNRIMELFEEAECAFTNDPPEHWATIGFEGRAELLFGNRHGAYSCMVIADRGLRHLPVPNPTYELNNLIWLLRAGSVRERVVRLPRMLSLIRQTDQTRRYLELLPIVLGGDWLYRATRRILGK